MSKNTNYSVNKTAEEWKEELSSESYRVLRESGTEPAFSGQYNDHFKSGKYSCKACGQELYQSNSKFDSGCGWPSFDKSEAGSIEYVKDTSFGMIRTEIKCANCGSHQGHVFNDGPTDTGMRYCVNSAAINFNENDK